jgi:hypothetical protein
MAASTAMIDPPGWVFCFGSYFNDSVDVLLKWLSEQWPDYPTKPKLGGYGWVEGGQIACGKAMAEYCQAHPDEFEWVGNELEPVGSMMWAGPIEKLKDCDYIFTVAGHPGGISMLRDYRAKGYKATWISNDSFATNVALTVNMVGWQGVDGTLEDHPTRWWHESYPLIETLEEIAHRYYPNAAADMESAGIGFIGGGQQAYAMSVLLAQVLQQAGTKTVDGQTIYDAAITFKTTFEGYPEWGFSETKRYAASSFAMYKWSAEAGDLVRISDWLAVGE